MGGFGWLASLTFLNEASWEARSEGIKLAPSEEFAWLNAYHVVAFVTSSPAS